MNVLFYPDQLDGNRDLPRFFRIGTPSASPRPLVVLLAKVAAAAESFDRQGGAPRCYLAGLGADRQGGAPRCYLAGLGADCRPLATARLAMVLPDLNLSPPEIQEDIS